MGRHKRGKNSFTPKKNLITTHLRVTPSVDDDGRHIHICSSAYHYGPVHPSAFKTVKHCGIKCNYFKKFYLEDIAFDEERLGLLLEKATAKTHANHVLQMRPQRDENNRPFYWALDRGEFVYLARPKKVKQIDRIEEDHFKLYVDTLEAIH